MSLSHFQLLLLKGTIKNTKDEFYKLPFLAKLEFYAKWLNTTFQPLNDLQEREISAYRPTIQMLLNDWKHIAKKKGIDAHRSDLQNFRLSLDKDLICELQCMTDNKEQLVSAKLLKDLISRGGFYQRNVDVPLTFPDPQLQRSIKNILMSLRLQRLMQYKTAFESFTLRAKKQVLRVLGEDMRAIPRKAVIWTNRVKNLLSRINSQQESQKFVGNLLSSYKESVQKLHIAPIQNGLCHQWKINAQRRQLMGKNLFIEHSTESENTSLSSARSILR